MLNDGSFLEDSNYSKNIDRVPLYFHEILVKLYNPPTLSMNPQQLQVRNNIQNQLTHQVDLEVDNDSDSETENI